MALAFALALALVLALALALALAGARDIKALDPLRIKYISYENNVDPYLFDRIFYGKIECRTDISAAFSFCALYRRERHESIKSSV